jgi:hypothetical protein
MQDWASKRLAELEAAAPIKVKKAQPFVQLPLDKAARAARATRSQKVFVWMWLEYRAWKTKCRTVTASNDALAGYGISRECKRRALADLEAAGMVTVERGHGKSPEVTLTRPGRPAAARKTGGSTKQNEARSSLVRKNEWRV